ncbi:hypothetical protein [Mycoplasmopsis gallinacea]|uniref:Uncharacterized protein n=1 Tax=Mycoplasmopsis gallinacea TaxID=29556 RepID=A0A6H0V488_9BACT|nr:hypothetical protein [Mycoplasmopsis gallinacea]QIW62519.1 hypothetical protein GOQ20_03815 [Mycoplasmopsis gallinacea]
MNRASFFETEQNKTLYIYKAITKDNTTLTFEKNSVNVIALEMVKVVDALILSKGSQPILDSSETVIKLSSAQTFSLQLNEHLNFELNDFFLFSFKDLSILPSPNVLNDLYYIQDKSQMIELYEEEFEEINITQLKFLKELNGVDFIITTNVEDYKNAFHTQGKKTVNFYLNDPTLLNSITLYQNTKGIISRVKSEYVRQSSVSNEFKPFMFFVNPINVKANTYDYYFWTLSNYKNLNPRNLFLFRENGNQLNLLNLLNLDSEAYAVIKACCYVTSVLTSPNTSDFNDEFKKTYTMENTPNNYNNNQIQRIIDKYKNSGQTDAAANFKAVVYALSNHIKSDFNYGGGMKKGFTLTTPFYIEYVQSKPEPTFYLRSDHFWIGSTSVTGKFGNEFLNLNSFMYDGSQIQLPIVPDEIEELDFSQNPIDFNEKSLNLNYPIWFFSSDNKIADFFNFKLESIADDEIVERTYEFSGTSKASSSEIAERFINDVGINYKVIGSTVLSTRTSTTGTPNYYNPYSQETTYIYETIKVTGRKVIDGSKFFENRTDFIFINKNDLKKNLAGLFPEGRGSLEIQTENVDNLDNLKITSLYLDISHITVNGFSVVVNEDIKKRHNLSFKFW